MSEAFKNLINHEVVTGLAHALKNAYPEFEREEFVARALSTLDSLELKARVDWIKECLKPQLPADFTATASIFRRLLSNLAEYPVPPWAVMSLGLYVADQGMSDTSRNEALDLLRAFTVHFSSEFSIRPFLDKYPAETLEKLQQWKMDKDPHVRRLVSEGSRPRLPWGMRLSGFVKDPAPLLPLLDNLKDDPEEFVRRSVANNLNDIAKDHPDLVAEVAAKWLQDKEVPKTRKKLVKHALRTLLKEGHPQALALFGFHPPVLHNVSFEVKTPVVKYGEALEFEFTFEPDPQLVEKKAKLQIDYRVHFMKANGQIKPKIFKGSVITLKDGKSIKFKRRHPIVPITTRKYYPGRQSVDICINGKIFAGGEFELVM